MSLYSKMMKNSHPDKNLFEIVNKRNSNVSRLTILPNMRPYFIKLLHKLQWIRKR